LRVRDLEPTPGIDARDLHEPLTTSTLELLNDHGHGRDDGTYGQSEAPRSLLTLGVADVVQP
jgi:hypothetical protein